MNYKRPTTDSPPATCPDGHPVYEAHNYCPECGAPTRGHSTGTLPEGHESHASSRDSDAPLQFSSTSMGSLSTWAPIAQELSSAVSRNKRAALTIATLAVLGGGYGIYNLQQASKYQDMASDPTVSSAYEYSEATGIDLEPMYDPDVPDSLRYVWETTPSHEQNNMCLQFNNDPERAWYEFQVNWTFTNARDQMPTYEQHLSYFSSAEGCG